MISLLFIWLWEFWSLYFRYNSEPCLVRNIVFLRAYLISVAWQQSLRFWFEIEISQIGVFQPETLTTDPKDDHSFSKSLNFSKEKCQLSTDAVIKSDPWSGKFQLSVDSEKLKLLSVTLALQSDRTDYTKWPWETINRTQEAISTCKFRVSWEISYFQNIYLMKGGQTIMRGLGIRGAILHPHLPWGGFDFLGHLSGTQTTRLAFRETLVTVNRHMEVSWLKVLSLVRACLRRCYY